ncbi:MAG: glycosyltransferase [Thermodesulfobacteriota bacterium]|nr:glycosyltransferase [Thermodesulfobacteriota bacterium]
MITTLNIGGAEKTLFNLLSSMDKSFFLNSVISLTDIGSVGQEMMKKGIPVYSLNMPNGRLTFTGMAMLWRLLSTIRPVILQTWLYHSDLLGLIFGRLSGIKNICWNIRCSYMKLDDYRVSTRWVFKLCSILSSIPKVVVTNSLEARQFHRDSGYRPNQWKVIPNGFDLNQFKPDVQTKASFISELIEDSSFWKDKRETERGKCLAPISIGFVARCDPMKDHSTFFKAAFLLLQENKDVCFILAGKGITEENNKLLALIQDNQMDHFRLLGERSDIPKVTAALDIACSVSHGEGFPNTIGEAMACGVPCVVTDVGDSAMIVGGTGRVVPPRNPEALAAAWKALIDLGEEGRSALGEAARRRIQEHFELSRIVGQYERLYRSLVGKD